MIYIAALNLACSSAPPHPAHFPLITRIGYDTGRDPSSGFTTALGARKRLSDVSDLQSDAELNSNAIFIELREAVRASGAGVGNAVTKRVHFYLALRQMLSDVRTRLDSSVCGCHWI